LFAPRRQVALRRAGEWEGGQLEGRHVTSGHALCIRRSVRHRGNNALEQEGAKKAVNTQIPSPRLHSKSPLESLAAIRRCKWEFVGEWDEKIEFVVFWEQNFKGDYCIVPYILNKHNHTSP